MTTSSISEINEFPGVSFESEMNALMVVLNPGAETVFAGGLMLMTANWRWHVISVTEGRNRDLRRRFFDALSCYDATGSIGSLDRSDPRALSDATVAATVAMVLPARGFDLVVTHDCTHPSATRRHHNQVSRAVFALFENRMIRAKELWMMADSPASDIGVIQPEEIDLKAFLLPNIWTQKQQILARIYGHEQEMMVNAKKEEGFCRFRTTAHVRRFLEREAARQQRVYPHAMAPSTDSRPAAGS